MIPKIGMLFLILITQYSCKYEENNKRILVASAGKITSLDPAQANTFHSLQLISAMGDTLYKVNKEGEIEPSLAKELPIISDSGMKISIHLRDDVFFHDGTKFDAKAMKFSIERFIKIGTLNYIIGDRIESISAPKKYILELKLKRPSTSLTGLLTSTNLTPVSPSSYSNHKNKFLNKEFIGTGPYKLINFRSNQQQSLSPFNLYWGVKPRNSGIDFISLSNSTSLYGAMIKGEIDVLLSTSIDEDQRSHLNKISKQGFMFEGEGPAMEIGYITFRTNAAPLNDKKLRNALQYSIDRELISQRVSYGLREPLKSIVPPNLHNKNFPNWPSYNPIYAKSLLKELGFCNRNKLSLPLTYRSNVPADKLLALTWQSQINRDFSDCIELTLNGIESTTIYRQLGQGVFQSIILDWRGSYPDPESYLSPLLSCRKSNQNVCLAGESVMSGSFWTKPGLEKDLKLSDKYIGKQRLKKLAQIQKSAIDGAAYLPVWLVKPRAWSQIHLSKPEFDGNGHLLMDRLLLKGQ